MPADNVTLEMTITLEDFQRRLADAVGPFEQVERHFQGHGWRLRVSELPGTRLGVLSLGRLRVDLEFEGFTPAEREAFMARFRLHFHRGGG